MPVDEPKDYTEFKDIIWKALSGYSYEYSEPVAIYHPYSFVYKFILHHMKYKLDWALDNSLSDIIGGLNTQDFIFNTEIAFEFYYSKTVDSLADRYCMKVRVGHLEQEIKKLFIYNNLSEFMQVFHEIFDIFRQDIETGDTVHLDMSIRNFENYCAISQL